MNKTWKNLVFDFGGVIIRIDYTLTRQAFELAGVKNFDAIYSQKDQIDLFNRLETGNISEMDFYEAIRNLAGLNLSDQMIESAWNAMLIDLPKKNMQVLERLQKDSPIFLLSNTNQIHEKSFSKIIERDYGLQKFNSLFKRIYYSHQHGMRKPNKNFFQKVLVENNLIAEETLFIDDSIQHVEGAIKAGLQAMLLEKDKTLSDYF